METNKIRNRIWELDFLRGIALLLMIYFHTIYDMKEIFGYKVDYSSGINYFIGKTSAILFILISGISCSLSRNNFKRGLRVLTIALTITLATWLYNPKFIILFGILHFLGTCMLLSNVFVRLKSYILWGMGTFIILLGTFISDIPAKSDYLFVLGMQSNEFVSADYYPLVPWLGIFLFGISLGKILYGNKKSRFRFTIRDNFITFIGQHTLISYLIHQPVILGVLALIGYLFK